MLSQDYRVGLENLLGRKVIDDPRVKELEERIQVLLDEYEALLVAIALEQGIINQTTNKEIH